MQAGYVEELKAGKLPQAMQPLVQQLLFKPDKNSIEYKALETAASSTLFTTHTPVAAGNDAFAYDLMDRYIGRWPGVLNTTRDELYGLARHDQNWDGQVVPAFSMTVFALRMSRAANGVSDTLSVIDIAERRVVATVPTGRSPWGVVIAP